jgi:hypothetical protein
MALGAKTNLSSNCSIREFWIDDRYFDVFLEYAKASPDDILVIVDGSQSRGGRRPRFICCRNFGFRNTWSWRNEAAKPHLFVSGKDAITAQHKEIGSYELFVDYDATFLFCENETNVRRLFGKESAATSRMLFTRYVINGRTSAVNPDQLGNQSGPHMCNCSFLPSRAANSVCA